MLEMGRLFSQVFKCVFFVFFVELVKGRDFMIDFFRLSFDSNPSYTIEGQDNVRAYSKSAPPFSNILGSCRDCILVEIKTFLHLTPLKQEKEYLCQMCHNMSSNHSSKSSTSNSAGLVERPTGFAFGISSTT